MVVDARRALGIVVGLSVGTACAADDGGRNGGSIGSSLDDTGIGVGSEAGEADDQDGDGDGDGDGSLDDGAIKFDLPAGDGTGANPDGGATGCQKVDVVMSVDNSGSMQEEIAALRGPVFDSFPDALLAVNGGLLDFHLAVIDACNDPPFFHNHGKSGSCNFANGANYMVSSNPALTAEYACVTDLSTSGYGGMPDGCSGSNDDEQPSNTAADSVNENVANAGFLRDDAVLLVVAITDEDEQPVPAVAPQAIADKIIAAAGGIQNVVFLGIGGASECNGPYGSADHASVLQDVTQIFVDAGRGLFWDLCQGNLEGAFQSVVDVVDVACMDFVPEG